MNHKTNLFTTSKDTAISQKEHPFARFLSSFVPEVAKKTKQLNQANWILDTTGSADAADLKATLDAELRFYFHNGSSYQQLLVWDKDPHLVDPILKRQLNVLIRTFKQNQIPKSDLETIAQREAALAQSYANFRAEYEGKKVSENEIREILKREIDLRERKEAWEASKKIGEILAPQILSLVSLRNSAAQALGYPDYFHMQLDLQEVDPTWLIQVFQELEQKSDGAYSQVLSEIEKRQAQRFAVPAAALGPWAWSEPFAQEDPLDVQELDQLVQGVDIAGVSAAFYRRMGIDVAPILARSDMEERPGKNQHAFCIHIDRNGDVRTLNNVKSTIKWLETVLHELGHAIYELGFDEKLPWLLREPPHMIPTEAMALIAGRQAYKSDSLQKLLAPAPSQKLLLKKAGESLRRRQLIFSRWVLTMTAFERELYRDPAQDLNRLWWHFVEKYQKIRPTEERAGKADWAAKYHIGLAPVYYFSYLLGEMLASAMQEALGSSSIDNENAGHFFQQKLFAPGNRMNWSELARFVTGHPLTPDAWLREFASGDAKR